MQHYGNQLEYGGHGISKHGMELHAEARELDGRLWKGKNLSAEAAMISSRRRSRRRKVPPEKTHSDERRRLMMIGTFAQKY